MLLFYLFLNSSWPEGIFASHLPLQRTGSWVGEELRRDTAGNAVDTQHYVTSCLAAKAGGKEEEGGMFMVIMFVFPRYHLTC